MHFYRGIIFCTYIFVKEDCRLWAQPRFDTFHQLLIIADALWSQLALKVFKQVVVTQDEIRDVRRVVKQLQVQMLQQCSSASSCMRTRIFMEEHYTGCQHSKPSFRMALRSFLVFRMQYTCDVIVVPCCMNCTLSAPFLSQKTVAIRFLEGRRMFKLFRLVWWICVHPLLWLIYQKLTLPPAWRPVSLGRTPPGHDKVIILEEGLTHSVHTNVHHKSQVKQTRISKNAW
jgi:hypothetical protein